MRKLVAQRVLIIGLGATGVETAKNVILQGTRAVSLHDPRAAETAHLGLNFCLAENSVGQPLDLVCVPRLQELNKECAVTRVEAITEEVIAAHTVVVVTSYMSQSDLVKWNSFCRNHSTVNSADGTVTPTPISFMYSFTGGMYSSVFVDHGAAPHTVTDADGEQPLVRIVNSVTNDKLGGLVRYTVPDGQVAISLDEGMVLEFSDVEGMTEVNGQEYKVAHVKGDPVNTFRICDTSTFAPYVGCGTITEKKQPVLHKFRPFSEVLESPGELPMTDMINFGSEYHQHTALRAVLEYQTANGGSLPSPNSAADAAAVLAIARKIDGDVDAETVTAFAVHAAVEMQAMGAFLGGVVAQEVVKVGGKYTPINGFLHFNAAETLPEEKPSEKDATPVGGRYDNLILVFGKAFVDKLNGLNYFMVGCGALGCEFLKNFALNGVCCGPGGKLTVTDADRVELSNLARQFLFREDTVGKPKSTSACAKATQMNGSFKPEALEMFVGPNTEEHFNDEFWLQLDGVCNALDNMEARFYVDKQCVKYGKSLLESGTMGTGGNVDPIVPKKTKTYRDGGDAVEGGGIPMCTLRNFPHLIDHCIEWSRDQFEAIFVKPVKRAGVFCEDPEAFIGDMQEKISDPSAAAGACTDVASLIKTLKSAQSATLESCAQLAFDYFFALFRDKLVDLITTYPKDARVVKDGVDKGPFWSEKKKFPQPANEYDGENESHVNFMLSTTHLIAEMLGVHGPYGGDDPEWLSGMREAGWMNEVVGKLTAPAYVPGIVVNEEDEGGKAAEEKEEEEEEVSSGDALTALLKDLEQFRGMKFGGKDADFEKDDDHNFHIEFVTSASNMRAGNYSIPKTDFAKAKTVAGKIIPAIATTTAAVTGLVLLELFKMVQGKDIGAFRNRQIGLAMNTFTSFEPDPPNVKKSTVKKVAPPNDELGEDDFDEKGLVKETSFVKEVLYCYPDEHTCWDKIIVDRDMTLKDFQAFMENEHKLQLVGWGMAKDPFVYPPKPSYGEEVLPGLDDGQGDAFKKIRADKRIAAKDKMLVLSMWQKAKKTGEMPVAVRSTLEMTLTELLTVKHGLDLGGRALVELEGCNFRGMDGVMIDEGTSAGGIDAETPAVFLKLK